ncbi:hypothetical protein OG589_44795 [Sphaerisporangium sp. NBC_01403]|uniref:hypothetical protein n=1 Tax=Sphaerisporangium sp. NBC_01403 TaxID=2903599 RepID=UPI0032499840
MVLVGSIVFVSLHGEANQASSAELEPVSAATSAATVGAPVPSQTSSAGPQGSPAAHGQAVDINNLLNQSEPSRGKLRHALGQVLRCSKVSQAISSMHQVTDQRAEQLKHAKELKVDALNSGEELKLALVDALSASYRADEAYLKWAKRYKSHRCSGPTVGDSAYDAGNVASKDATAAKANFVAMWNSIAQQEGLPDRTEDEI